MLALPQSTGTNNGGNKKNLCTSVRSRLVAEKNFPREKIYM